MDAILEFLTQPLTVVVIAIAVFVGRVMYLAKRLKSAARNPTLVDLRALEEAKKALDAHRESLDVAKETLSGNLGGARDTLRTYKKPFARSVESRRSEIARAMDDLGRFDEPLTDAKAQQKAAFRQGFKDAKALYKKALPRKVHRAPKD